MRAVSPGRRRVNGTRRKAVEALYAAAPWCARCGKADVPLAGHERLGRSQGGDPADPDCLLCDPCNEWCEDFPISAAWNGWKVSDKHPRCPVLGPDEAWDLADNRVIFADLLKDKGMA